MIFKKIYTKINSGIIKIPTLIGLGILLIGLAGGVYLTTENQILKTRAAVLSTPKNINIYNLSANSAAISWQTDEAATGFIQAGAIGQKKSAYRDDRDSETPQPHKLHFVTLTNLIPDTTYYYQIYSGQIIYPNIPAVFTTPSTTQALNWNPIVGTILDIHNRPIDEALIVFELEDAQKLAAITKTGGNFIMPLSNLRTTDLTKSFFGNNTPHKAKLIITGPLNSSETTITIPPESSSLPPITLGQNTDLAPKSAGVSAEIQKYDLNGDGIINAQDVSIILKNFGAIDKTSSISAEKQKIDLNKDGIIDQKDVNLILPYLK